MKILITGHKGFLGAEFIKRYEDDYEIVGFDHKDGDELLDYDSLLKRMDGCKQVIHLAAIPKPVPEKSFDDYVQTNAQGTHNVAKAALENGIKRIVYGSSTTVYGVERGIPFSYPILENQHFVSQYLKADDLSCRECDLSYHVSKIMAEQIMAWYGLNKKIQTISLRFGPIGKVFLGTSVSTDNACQAIKQAIDYTGELWYEALSIVDDLDHLSNQKAKDLIGYCPQPETYSPEQIRSTLEERAT